MSPPARGIAGGPDIAHRPAALATSRIPLGRASLLASSAIREAARLGIPAQSVTPVGGVRRFAPDVADTALLAAFAPTHQADVLERFTGLPMVTSVLERKSSAVRLGTLRGALTVHVANPDTVGAAMVWHTGSRRHTVALAERAATRDLVFAAGELRQRSGSVVTVTSEEELYRLLDLPLIPPELREGDGEIAAAERGDLPCLVSTGHMRGDLHMHTAWSDGRDTVDSMARTAHGLGYEYVAITDHSERAWSSRRLTAADIPRQREEIEAVRQSFSGFSILHGVEVDIMPDGSLDFDDEILAGFDIVLASLHDQAGQTRRELTERYLSAIRHPLVNVITHPANRSPALSDGYDLDFDRVIAAAFETGTALEIDGAPGHLDMDGALARRAAQAGVTVTIDSDCHRSDALARQMRYGIGTARRGWIEPHQVLNTRSVDDVRRFIADKRAGR
ncbi:MAG TPA: PHP domain-containing protein [Vicinamibacterales bacterium]|nr:PHP domain-containing protein [Vicinamibacterales bacterium]